MRFIQPELFDQKKVFAGFSIRGDQQTHTSDMSRVKQFKGYRVISLKQEHTTAIACYPGGALKTDAYDGVITMRQKTILTLKTADCLPILFHDPSSGVIGAIHAGWRGLAGEIIPKGIEAAIKYYKLNPETTQVVIGPGINGCCYRVSPDFPDHFPDFPDAIRGLGKQISFDLDHVAVKQLHQMGIGDKQIEVIPFCTCCQEPFFSYRRDQTTARNISFIGLG